MNSNIFIVGPPGAGKTTIGKKLSTMRNFTFYDVDCVIVERAGVDLAWILDKEGPEGFKSRQEKIIAELSEYERVVVAAGASVVESNKNLNKMSKRGIIVCLNPYQEQENIDKVFTKSADVVISVINKNIKAVIDEILERIKI